MQNKHATEQVDKTDAREWVQVLDDVFPLVRFSLVICCNEKVWDPVWCTVSFISFCVEMKSGRKATSPPVQSIWSYMRIALGTSVPHNLISRNSSYNFSDNTFLDQAGYHVYTNKEYF